MRMVGLLALAVTAAGCAAGDSSDVQQPILEARSKAIIEADGLQFRDLDGDGALTPYEDWRLAPEDRAVDLVSRMTLPEKAGSLVHGNMPGLNGAMADAADYDREALGKLLSGKHITSFITRLTLVPAELAEANNRIQAMAEDTRLGIPLTISTDPRNHFQSVLGVAESAAGVTRWPELPGLAALRSPDLVRQFGDVARREYRAVGIHMALSPQLDLATEPRWARINGTFGSSPELASELGAAYVEGMQGSADGLTPGGAMTVVKHWVGYGAQPEGFDAHNYYGRYASLGDNLDLHARAFQGALAAKTAGVMPAYPILRGTTLDGEPLEEVGPGYSRQLLTSLLREKHGFDGFILSDFAITNECTPGCRAPTAEAPQGRGDISTAWGVDDLSKVERFAKGLAAGLDQFGGTDEVAPIIEGVESGVIPLDRVDDAVRRIMIPKFRLGLFDNPYVDPQAAAQAIGQPDDVAAAELAQRESQILLENKDNLVPLAPDLRKVWLLGVDPAAAEAKGLTVVDDMAEADFVLIRTRTPAELLHPHHFFGRLYNEGRLDFRAGDAAYDALLAADDAGIPAVFAIFLDRPAILTNVQGKADAILANFGASDTAVLDVLTGTALAKGKLPYELPRSMAAVEAQDPAVPDDSKDPLYRFGEPLSR